MPVYYCDLFDIDITGWKPLLSHHDHRHSIRSDICFASHYKQVNFLRVMVQLSC